MVEEFGDEYRSSTDRIFPRLGKWPGFRISGEQHPAEHSRKRGPDDRRQLSPRKLLVDEPQRLDEGNGVHDIAQQVERPPGVVGGELQEPHGEELPPQGGPFVERVEQGGGRRVEHRSAVTLTPVPLPQGRSKLAHKQHGRPPTKIAS